MGVHDDLVGLDCFEGAFGESAELVGVVALGLLDQGGFDLLALGVADTGGQVPSGLHDHRRVRWGHQPSSRAVAVASCPDCNSFARATSRAAWARETVVVLATQASVPANPASRAVPVLSAVATSFSL